MQEHNNITTENSSWQLFKRVYHLFFKTSLSKTILAIVSMIIVATCQASQAWLIKPVLNDIFLTKDKKMLLIIPLSLVGIALVKGTAAYFQNFFMKYVGQRFVTDMQNTLYNHLIYADLSYINRQNTGKLLSRFTSDIQILRSAIINIISGIGRELFVATFLIIVMCSLNFKLSLIVLIVFPLATLPVIKLGKRLGKLSNTTQEKLGEYVTQLDESFQGIRLIKCFRLEKMEISKTKAKLETIFSYYIKSIRTESFASPIIEALGAFSIALVILYGGYQVINGETTPGDFFAFIASFLMAYKPLKNLADLNNNIHESLATIRRIFKVLDERPTIVDAANAKQLQIIKGAIDFKQVTFKYTEKRQILNKLDLDIPAGKTVAIVGDSGGGKSTIMNLILRLYDPQDGIITIDNQDIGKVTLSSLRDNISIVTQDIILFDDTVYNNISCSNPHASFEEIKMAAKFAYADDFINTLPENYQTIIGQNGFRLSGGQKQRIALARAILKRAPILLLDEATSSLDNISEREIQKSIKKIRKNLTTIIIAHRLSTIVDCDLIYVVKNGKVVEDGTHQELMNKKGAYYKLYNLSIIDQD